MKPGQCYAGPVDDASLDRAIAEGRLLPGDVEAIREFRDFLANVRESVRPDQLRPVLRRLVDEERAEVAQEAYDRALGYVEDERGASC